MARYDPPVRERGTFAGENGVVKAAYRGLCVGCTKAARKDGSIAEYPLQKPRDYYPKSRVRQKAFLEDYHAFKDMGLSDAKIAANMGVQLDSLKRRLLRISRMGIVYTPPVFEEYEEE